jgi:hypothetical protein
MSLIAVYVAGFLTLIAAIYHTRLYKRLNWVEEFEKINISNRKILYTIHIALTILFFLLGTFTLVYAEELSKGSGLALGFNVSLACFWIWRRVWGAVFLEDNKEQNETLFNRAKKWVPVFIAFSYLVPVVNSFLII